MFINQRTTYQKFGILHIHSLKLKGEGNPFTVPFTVIPIYLYVHYRKAKSSLPCLQLRHYAIQVNWFLRLLNHLSKWMDIKTVGGTSKTANYQNWYLVHSKIRVTLLIVSLITIKSSANMLMSFFVYIAIQKLL